MKKTHGLAIILILLIVVVIGASFSIGYFRARSYGTTTAENEHPTPPINPTLTPFPLAQGKQIYTIQSGSTTGPQIKTVTIDPFDPKPGETQTVVAKITSNTPITSAILEVKSDNGTHTYPMTLDGNADWTVSYPTVDTHDFNYQEIIRVSDGTRDNHVDLTFR